MNLVLFVGVLLDTVLLVWLILSARQISKYLRRIALSLPVTGLQMKLINGTISTQEAMVMFEQAGGKFELLKVPSFASASAGPELYRVRILQSQGDPENPDSIGPNAIDPELLQILQVRMSEIRTILVASQGLAT